MRIAALDLGSNSFHLLVVETRPDGSFVPLVREKEMLRLGDVVAREGRLTEDAVEAAVDTVRRFKTIAEAHRVDEIVAMATAALREAANGPEAAERIEAETGVAVKVVSGIREARPIFDAVRASVLIDPSPALCADLGGGSLELSVGDRFDLAYATSLHLGVGRLTTEYVRTDPPGKKDRTRLRERIEQLLDEVLPDVLACGPKLLIGTSGTFCALARGAAAMREGVVPTSVNQLTVTARELGALGELIYELPSSERARLPGIEARRAELLPAGFAVTEVLMERTGMRELTVSEWALREGIVISTMGKHDRAEFGDDPRAIRRASVLSLCRRSRWRETHARQVARLAVELFDSTTPLHGLEAGDRELLELATLLHDIGEHVSRDGHARHSAYLIENGDLRGFSPVEIQMLACLARYHVRGRPRESFQAWETLERRDRDRVLKLLALLRIADGLDAAHGSVISHVGVELSRAGVEIVVSAWGRRSSSGGCSSVRSCFSRSCSRFRSALRWCRLGRRSCRPGLSRRLVWPDGRRLARGRRGCLLRHAPERLAPLAQARTSLHAKRKVGAGADRDRKPEVEQAPGDHAQPCDTRGDVEADESRGGNRLDDAQATRGERHGGEDVREPVGDEEVDREGDVAVGGDEGPQRSRVEEPVRSSPQHGVLQQLPIGAQRPHTNGQPLDERLDLLGCYPGHVPSDGLQGPDGVVLAPGERQHEGSESREQHSTDDGDRDIGAVEPVEGDGYDESDPEHGVQNDCRTDPLGRERKTGVSAVHAVRGEEPVTEPRPACRTAGDHMAHGQCRQVDAEHLGEARSVLWQQRSCQAAIGDKGSGLECKAAEEAEEVDAPQLAQRRPRFGVEKTGNDDVLDEHEADEQSDAVPKRPWDPAEQLGFVPPRGRFHSRAVDLGQVGHLSMLAGATRLWGEPGGKPGLRQARPPTSPASDKPGLRQAWPPTGRCGIAPGAPSSAAPGSPFGWPAWS